MMATGKQAAGVLGCLAIMVLALFLIAKERRAIETRPATTSAQIEGVASSSAPLGQRETAQQSEFGSMLTIGGRVAYSDGGPPPAGFAVAWPVGFSPQASDFALSGKEVAVVPTSRDGSFVLHGLMPGPYVVSATSPGGICLNRVVTQAGAHDVLVKLDYLHGVIVELADASGQKLRTNEFLFGSGPTMHGKSGHGISNAPIELVLSNVDGLTLGPPTRDRLEYLVASHERQESVTFDFAVAVPGYSPLRETVVAPRVETAIVKTIIRLDPLPGISYGSLVVRCFGGLEYLGFESGPDEKVGSVILLGGGEASLAFALCIADLLAPKTLEGVPCGEYRWIYESIDGYFSTQETPIVIGPGFSQIDIDLSGTGALVLDLDLNEAPYTGLIQSAAFLGTRGEVFHLGLRSAPLAIPLLPPGELRLKNISIPGALLTNEVPPLVIEAGHLTRQRIMLTPQ